MLAVAFFAFIFSLLAATGTTGLRRFMVHEGNSRPVRCGSFEFKCNTTNRCIHKAQLCDGRDQCGDRSDETTCTTCQHVDLFRCANATQCIPKLRECDRVIDCSDGSDEQNCSCPERTFRCTPTRNASWRYRSPCISWYGVCDGRKDCPLGEDESPYACWNATFQHQFIQPTVHDTPAIDLDRLPTEKTCRLETFQATWSDLHLDRQFWGPRFTFGYCTGHCARRGRLAFDNSDAYASYDLFLRNLIRLQNPENQFPFTVQASCVPVGFKDLKVGVRDRHHKPLKVKTLKNALVTQCGCR